MRPWAHADVSCYHDLSATRASRRRPTLCIRESLRRLLLPQRRKALFPHAEHLRVEPREPRRLLLIQHQLLSWRSASRRAPPGLYTGPNESLAGAPKSRQDGVCTRRGGLSQREMLLRAGEVFRNVDKIPHGKLANSLPVVIPSRHGPWHALSTLSAHR